MANKSCHIKFVNFELRFQTTTNYLVCSLAASDLVIGVCVLADCILYHFNMCAFHYEECIVTTCVQTIAVVASNVNLLQVQNLERSMAAAYLIAMFL